MTLRELLCRSLHDIRNDTTSMISSVYLLRRKVPISPAVADAVDDMEHAVDRVIDRIKKLDALSKQLSSLDAEVPAVTAEPETPFR